MVIDPTPTFAVGAHRSGNGIAFSLKGVAGLTYAVETTTDLLDPGSWTGVFTDVMPGSRILDFADDDAHAADPARWYRGAHVP